MARQKISSIIFKGIIISLIFCFPEILQAKNIDIGSAGDSVRIFGTNFCLGDTNCISTWNDISGSWTRNGTSIYYNNGLVGIGITNPTAALDVYRTEPFRTRGQVVFGGSAYIGSGTRLLTVDNVGNVIAAPIASTVGLPTSATAGQTLRYNGTSWVANPALYSNGTNVGVGTSDPDMKLHVQGSAYVKDVLRVGNFRHVLSAGFTTTATNGYLLTTTLPYNGTTNLGMHTIRIQGFAYGLNRPIDFVVNVYLHSSGFSTYGWTNYGAYDPGIVKLSYEGNVLKLWWSNVLYYPSFEVFTTSWIGAVNNNTYFEGWTITDAPAPTSNVVNVPYKNAEPQGLTMKGNISLGSNWLSGDGGNEGIFVNNTGSVGIGITTPSQKLHVAGIAQLDAISFGITPGTTQKLALSTVEYVNSMVSGVGTSTVGYWSQNGNNIYNANSGNVGIGTSNPHGKLDIYADNILSATQGDLTLEHPTSGGASSIVFPSRSNYGSDYGYITYSDTNPTYAYWGTSAENSSLVIGTQNDAMNGSSDIVALRGAAADIFGTASYPATMIINNSGNVGIGTTNPQSLLSLSNANGAILRLDTAGQAGTNTAPKQNIINFYGYANSLRSQIISEDRAASVYNYSNLYFNLIDTSGTTQTRIYIAGATGNVGIGTTTPAQKLHVAGVAQLDSISYGVTPGESQILALSTVEYVNSMVSGVGTSTVGYWSANGNNIYNANSGNVGIGTNNPTNKLNIVTTTSFPSLRIEAPNYAGFQIVSGSNEWHNSVDSNGQYYFWNVQDAKRHLVINKGGNVGIGTTAPTGKLTVVGSAGNTRSLTFDNREIKFRGDGVAHFSIYGPDTNKSYLTIQNTSSNSGVGVIGTDLFTILSNGKVGIGTTAPSQKLHVNGGAQFDAISYGVSPGSDQILALTTVEYVNSMVSGTGTSTVGYWSQNGNNIYNANSGNVGVGTTTPANKLDVAGNININEGSTYLYNGVQALRLAKGNDTFYANTFVGSNAGNPTARRQTAIGYYAGNQNDGYFQTVLGYEAGKENVGNYQTAIGVSAGVQNIGEEQLALGSSAGYQNTGFFQTAIGSSAGRENTGEEQLVIGFAAGYRNMGYYQTAIGSYAGNQNGGDFQTAIGGSAGAQNIGEEQIAIGSYAGYQNTGNQVIGIGPEATRGNIASDVVAIGYQAGMNNTVANQFIVQQTNINPIPLIQGNFVSGSVGIGTTAPSQKLHVNGGAQFDAVSFGVTPGLDQDLALATVEYVNNSISGSGSFLPITGGTLQGDINMGNNDILNVNKLTAGTVDPLYRIQGVNYSTFASSVVGGVKEEYVGKLRIEKKKGTGEYEAVIDFAQMEKGSDLWVWRQVVDFSQENVDVLITPYNSFAHTYYTIENEKIILRSNEPVSISYRLIGRRHDWREWPTQAKDQTEKPSFIID